MYQIKRHPEAFSKDLSTNKKRKRIEESAHLAFIRKLPCLATGKRPVEAAHIRYGAPLYAKRSTGAGEKPDDKWTVPLHPDAHRAQHSVNEAEWWRQQGIDPCAAAMALHGASGDIEAGELIIREFRASAKL